MKYEVQNGKSSHSWQTATKYSMQVDFKQTCFTASNTVNISFIQVHETILILFFFSWLFFNQLKYSKSKCKGQDIVKVFLYSAGIQYVKQRYKCFVLIIYTINYLLVILLTPISIFNDSLKYFSNYTLFQHFYFQGIIKWSKSVNNVLRNITTDKLIETEVLKEYYKWIYISGTCR